MKVNNRDYLFDNLKVLLIFLVVFGHAIELYINDKSILKAIYFYIYLFHMPLFIFITGYFSKNIEKYRAKIVENLVIPYIVFTIIWYLFISILNKDFTLTFIYPGWILWYMFSLIIWKISLPVLSKIKYIIPISFILGLLIGCEYFDGYVFSISRTIVFLPYFLLGYYVDKSLIDKIRSVPRIVYYGIIILGFIISVLLIKRYNVNVGFLYNSRNYYEFNLSIMQGILYRSITYLMAIVLSTSIIGVISSHKNIFSYIGERTLLIYIIHAYIIKIMWIIIPFWNISVLKNIIIIVYPIFIVFILANKNISNIYKLFIEKINESIYKVFIRNNN